MVCLTGETYELDLLRRPAIRNIGTLLFKCICINLETPCIIEFSQFN